MNINLINKNIISFDVGTKKIGVAIGNKIIKIAHPINTLNVSKALWIDIKKIIDNFKPYLFIIGFPNNIYKFKNNNIQNKIKKFYIKLKSIFKIRIILEDESFTTSESRIFIKENLHIFLNNKSIHSISAAIILNNWFLRLK